MYSRLNYGFVFKIPIAVFTNIYVLELINCVLSIVKDSVINNPIYDLCAS